MHWIYPDLNSVLSKKFHFLWNGPIIIIIHYLRLWKRIATLLRSFDTCAPVKTIISQCSYSSTIPNKLGVWRKVPLFNAISERNKTYLIYTIFDSIVWRNFSILRPKLVLAYAEDILSDPTLKNCAECKSGWCKSVGVERFEIWVKNSYAYLSRIVHFRSKTVFLCMWIQWSILQITTYYILRITYYILHTEWVII